MTMLNDTECFSRDLSLGQDLDAGVAVAAGGPTVMQICTCFRAGGIQRHVLDLGDFLRARQYRVVFAGEPDSWMNEGLDRSFVALDLDRVSNESSNLLSRMYHLVRCGLKLRGALRREKVDLIHAHETAPALAARIATLGLNIPIVYTYHGSVPERVGEVGRVARLTARQVITPSHQTAENLRMIGGVPRRKLAVIGLGIHQVPDVNPDRIGTLRRKLLGEGGRRLVVTVARLAPQKGIDVLIEAVKCIVAQQPDIRFVVVGDGNLNGQVDGWIEAAGVRPYIQFVGHSDEPHLYMRAADMFLLTSRWEALPITIVEAFRAGLPVVATDCGGVKELVDDDVGRVVPIEDVPAIAQAVLDICSNDGLREAMARAAFRRAQEDRFCPAHVHAQFDALYTKLIA